MDRLPHRCRFACLLAAAFALAVSSIASAAPARTWTDQQGRKIQAKLVRIHEGNVVFERGGKVLTVPFFRLSDEDQEYLRKQMESKRLGHLIPTEDPTARNQNEMGQAEEGRPAVPRSTSPMGGMSGNPYNPSRSTNPQSGTAGSSSTPSGMSGSPYNPSASSGSPYNPSGSSTPSGMSGSPYNPSASSGSPYSPSGSSSTPPGMSSNPYNPSSSSGSPYNPSGSSSTPSGMSGNQYSPAGSTSPPTGAASSSSPPGTGATPPQMSPPMPRGPRMPFSSMGSGGAMEYACGNCDKPVPNAKIGDKCPHCGVRWEYEDLGNGQVKDASGKVRPKSSVEKVGIGGGIAGVIAVVIYLLRAFLRSRD